MKRLLLGLLAVSFPLAGLAEDAKPKNPPRYFLDVLADVRTAGAIARDCDGLEQDTARAEAATADVMARMSDEGYADSDFQAWGVWLQERGFAVLVQAYFEDRGIDLSEVPEEGQRDALYSKICTLAADEQRRGIGAGQYLRPGA